MAFQDTLLPAGARVPEPDGPVGAGACNSLAIRRVDGGLDPRSVPRQRLLQAARPDVTRIDTGNADTNAQMVSINERLGFEVAAVSPSFVRNLEA